VALEPAELGVQEQGPPQVLEGKEALGIANSKNSHLVTFKTQINPFKSFKMPYPIKISHFIPHKRSILPYLDITD